MSPRQLLFLCASLCAFSGLAAAQESRATVTGHVTDPSTSGVVQAKVTIRNVASNEMLSATTTAEGDYTIPYVVPGNYDLTVEAAGFKKAVRPAFELHTGDKTTVDVQLEVGQVTETMTVTADAPLLDAATASRGGVIENLRVTELPINGRNPFQLANLSPGVQFNGNPQFIRPFDNGDNANFSINGGLRQSNEFLIDGTPDNAVTDTAGDRSHANLNVAYIPTVDATQEFKVVTNFYDAQYGRTGGGIINVSTKAGTNEYHGTLYEFMRRYQLDANNSGANAAGRPIYSVDPVSGKNLGGHKLDQYGVQLGGPVSIPKIYNGKDKTFFTFGFENYRESSPSPGLTSVPTLAERNGDFSADGINIYNPFTTTVNPNYNPGAKATPQNSPYIRSQFAGNVIPSSLLSPVGLAIARAYPAPNTGTPGQRFNNYLSSPNLSLDKFRNYLGRVDESLGQNERIFARYAHNRRDQFDQGTAVFPGAGFDAQDPLVRTNDSAVLDSTTVLSANKILDLRVGFSRYLEAAYRNHVYGFDDTQLGFSQAYSNSRFDPIPPRIQLEQYGTDFGTRNQRYNVSNTLSFLPSMSWIHGRNSIKFGGDYRDIRVNTASGSFVYGGGQFHFNRDYTVSAPGIADNTAGSAVASLLLGTPDSGIISYTPRLAYRWSYYALYFNDDVKLTQKLTLNLGVRWDVEGSPTERYNRMNRGFSTNYGTSPLLNNTSVKNANSADCPTCAGLAGGLLFAGVNGQPREAFNTNYDHWQPRAGFAWEVAKNTVVRGGFGMFYLPEAAFGGVAGFAADTAFISTTGTGANAYIPQNTLSNPFPNGLNQPTGVSSGQNTFLGQSVIFNNPNRAIPHTNQFSLGIERQLPFSIKLDASYVGSRTYDINTNDNQSGAARNLNVLSASALAQGAANPTYLSQSVSNPFAGLLPGTGLNGATTTRGNLLKPYPQFGNVAYGQESIGKIWYDALQVSVEKRYTQGLVLVAAYTWSKNIEQVQFLNDQDYAPVRNITSNDRPQRLVLSGVYELPFGRGKLVGKDVNRVTNLLIAGWEYNFIGTIQSGVPIGLPGNVNFIGNPAISSQTNLQYFNNCVLSVSGTGASPSGCSSPAWQLRGPNTLRTDPFRVSSLRVPVRPIWDMSLNKKFYATERYNFQFRFEAFNVFNTPIRNGPNTDPTSPLFGTISIGQSNIPRQVQLGFKLNF